MPSTLVSGTVRRAHRESSDLLSGPETDYGLGRCEAFDSLERINFEQIRVFKTSVSALNILA
jgi:hypothetical protein